MKLSKHRQIKSLTTRPTSAKVRQALFNIWQGRIVQSNWLDLCTGTGAIGAQAMLDGAARITGIEISRHACQVTQENWQRASSPAQTFQVIQGNILNKLKTLSDQQFDFIYFDPPYQSDLYNPVLESIASMNLLRPTGEMAIEHNPKFWQPTQTVQGLEMIRQKNYGDTYLSFFTVHSEEE